MNHTTFKQCPPEEIKNLAAGYIDRGLTLRFITATDERKDHGCFRIWYVFAAPEEHAFLIPFVELKNTEEFPSLAPLTRSAWEHERKIKTFFGLTPVGLPDQRQIILHENAPADFFPLRKDANGARTPKGASEPYIFETVAGEGIYEIPVGPIHAGIIEPGHFRFSVAGEEIVLLEPRLGFVHKGSEKIFEQLPPEDGARLSEKISGDSSFSHSLAYCQAVEELAEVEAPKRARYLRVVYAELERLANHFGDIGAIMLDTGFSFGGANGGRLREMIMRVNDRLTGSRFLRGMNKIGGLAKDIGKEEQKALADNLALIKKDFDEVMAVAAGSTALMNRLKGTGILPRDTASAYGVVGVAGRAVGIARDTRVDFPYAGYDELTLDGIAVETGGDVYARFRVRVKEVAASMDLISRALKQLPAGSICAPNDKIVCKKNTPVINVVEGWRGEIMYLVTTDADGRIARVAVRDPSFINWPALGAVGPGNVVPDFPLINKSFNLSYSGNDL